MIKKILVVDDEESIRDVLASAFKKADYDVAVASSADEALSVLKNDGFQVMFIDLNMPGMTGLELCRRIRHEHPMALIFAMTGYSSLFQLADCREAGFDDYFTKPVKIKTLLKTAEEAFDKLERWRKLS